MKRIDYLENRFDSLNKYLKSLNKEINYLSNVNIFYSDEISNFKDGLKGLIKRDKEIEEYYKDNNIDAFELMFNDKKKKEFDTIFKDENYLSIEDMKTIKELEEKEKDANIEYRLCQAHSDNIRAKRRQCIIDLRKEIEDGAESKYNDKYLYNLYQLDNDWYYIYSGQSKRDRDDDERNGITRGYR